MARFDDGELYVELENATPEQAHRALTAAKRKIADAGMAVAETIGALARRVAVLDQLLAWEAGGAPEPVWLTDEENDAADIGEEAEQAAQASVGQACRLGLVEQSPAPSPVARDLFEVA